MKTPRAIFITNKINIRYFSGFSGSTAFLVLLGKKGFLFTDSRYHLEAQNSLFKNFQIIDTTDDFQKTFRAFIKREGIKKIGFEGKHITFQQYKNLKKMAQGACLTDIKDLLDKKRIIKSGEEIEKIARAQILAEKVFFNMKKWLKPGLKEKDIAWKIETLAHDLGTDGVSFKPIVAINENSASPHHSCTDKKMARGDMILIDLGIKYKGYCSDMTRIVFTKNPSNEQIRVYETVLRAQNSAIKKIRAGAIGKEIDSLARNIIAQAGFGKYFGHALGHGVGLDIHELPKLSKKYADKLPAGSIVTVEPGIYLPGKFGVRIEDMIAVGKKRALNLTKAPKDIKSCLVSL